MSNRPDSLLNIAGKLIGRVHPTYFIADIAANHDGDLKRATALIKLAEEAGADSRTLIIKNCIKSCSY